MAKVKRYSIEARGDDKFKVAVKAGDRTLYVDQPLYAGGSDAGATPVDLLFSALAGCIATTARIIATQKKLILHGMDIKIDGSLDLDIIYGKSSTGRAGLSDINVRVSLDSEMSQQERESFFEELRVRCPVSDTIAAVTPITIAAA